MSGSIAYEKDRVRAYAAVIQRVTTWLQTNLVGRTVEQLDDIEDFQRSQIRWRIASPLERYDVVVTRRALLDPDLLPTLQLAQSVGDFDIYPKPSDELAFLANWEWHWRSREN